jgi:hypothetical protein
MKTLRKFLMILAVPAAVLYGLKEIGGTPLYKGDDVGLAWKAQANTGKLILTNDMGDITCLLRLRMAGTADYQAELANGTVLKTSKSPDQGDEGWIEVSAVSPNPQEKFKWPSGSGVFILPVAKQTAAMNLADWEIFLTDKHPDSLQRAKWRDRGFKFSLAFFVLALIGGALEANERLKEKPAEAPAPRPFTAQTLVEAMIQNVVDHESPADKAAARTKWMRAVLTKVVLENISPLDAMAENQMTENQAPDINNKILYLSAMAKLRRQSENFQQELSRLSDRLKQPFFNAKPFPITGPSEPARKRPEE